MPLHKQETSGRVSLSSGQMQFTMNNAKGRQCPNRPSMAPKWISCPYVCWSVLYVGWRRQLGVHGYTGLGRNNTCSFRCMTSRQRWSDKQAHEIQGWEVTPVCSFFSGNLRHSRLPPGVQNGHLVCLKVSALCSVPSRIRFWSLFPSTYL